MDSERRNLSITLPRNFMFHYRDGTAPQTPEPEPQPVELQPPPPPRQTLKVRRRRVTLVNQQVGLGLSTEQHQPIPTIEAPEFPFPSNDDYLSPPAVHNNAYLSPPASFSRLLSPPKTPIAQVRTIDCFDLPQQWLGLDATPSESSSRPTSSGGLSDSSMSSRGSFDSLMSRGGSCTSPEEEMSDPFNFVSLEAKYRQPSSPLAAQQSHPAKKLKLRATFTEEMDCHLWRTYMTYLQDPTVTPFKVLPSTTPPNGVCHRVARMARKTWKGPRVSRHAGTRVTSQFGRCGTPDTIRPLKSGSATPIAQPLKSYLRFPTEKQCRKRLRDLAKQKPMLSAHYQRLLRRSPSPLQSSPPPEPEPVSEPQQVRESVVIQASPMIQEPPIILEPPKAPRTRRQSRPLSSPFIQESSTFSFSRDMNLSLATSTATSMQMGNPLSQLANNTTPRPPPSTSAKARTSAHQKSQSLHINLGLGIENVLGSPFKPRSEVIPAKSQNHHAQTWHGAEESQQPRLGSPFQLHAPRPKSRLKRRGLQNTNLEEKTRTRDRGNSFVDDIFGAPAESSHRGVRSRGFSLGDMMDGARRLPLSSKGASTKFNPFVDAPALPSPAQTSPAVAAEVQGQNPVRLGSPFGSRPSIFPRASTSHGFEPAASFEERFAAISNDPRRYSRS